MNGEVGIPSDGSRGVTLAYPRSAMKCSMRLT